MNNEDTVTPRVCFSPHIVGCLNANTLVESEEAYAYELISVPVLLRPTHLKRAVDPYRNNVPDSSLTHEIWALEPCLLQYIGKIVVAGFKQDLFDKPIWRWIRKRGF